MNCKRLAFFLAVAVLAVGACGCSNGTTVSGGTAETTVSDEEGGTSATDASSQGTKETTAATATQPTFQKNETEVSYDASTVVRITLKDGESHSTASRSVTVDGQKVTIVREGTYLVTGALSAGKLVVDVTDKAQVRLILDGVSIASPDDAALHIKKAGQVVITLAENSRNTLSAHSLPDKVDGALYSKAPLALNGEGALVITSAMHGIVCKDTLAVSGGQYTVTADGHAVQSKGDCRMADGRFTLTAGRDGIHVEDADNAAKGSLLVGGGIFAVTAEEDGLSAAAELQISGGSGTVTCGGGAANGSSHSEGGMGGPGGWWGHYEQNQTATDEVSAKGLKAGKLLLVAAGNWELDTADDGLHSNGELTVTGGTVTVASGDDGLHADGVTAVQGGTVTVTKSYEGIEGKAVDISGGIVKVVSSDDGINAAGGADGSGYGHYQQDDFASSGDVYVRISGGKLTVNADGDGIDVNGNVYVTGGETYVSGPTNNGNGALDYDGKAEVTGGVFVAVGASGMAQNFSSADGQGALLVNGSFSGGEVVLRDAGGKELFRWTPEKSFNSIVLSCAGMKENGTYTLTVGGAEQTVTLDGWLYGNGHSMGGPGGGRPGGRW